MAAEAEVELQRTDDPNKARTLLEELGACVLVWPSVTKQAVIDAGEAVLGDRLRVRFPAMTLRPHQEPGQSTRIVRPEGIIWEATEPRTGLSDEPILARPNSVGIEGWGHGDTYPEVLAYLCQHEPATGGTDFLVDSYGLLAWLAVTPDYFDLHDALWSLPVPQRTHPKFPPRPTTLARRSPKGRVSVLYAPSSVVLGDGDDQASVAEMVALWHRVVEEAAAASPRFLLQRGEVLLIDNYRVFTAGRPTAASGRPPRWFWTDSALAYPMVRQRSADDLLATRTAGGLG